MKDWTGNKKSTFTCLGASNHVEHDRAEHDYYATEPKAADLAISNKKLTKEHKEKMSIAHKRKWREGYYDK